MKVYVFNNVILDAISKVCLIVLILFQFRNIIFLFENLRLS